MSVFPMFDLDEHFKTSLPLSRNRDGSRKRRKLAKERTWAKIAVASRKRNRA